MVFVCLTIFAVAYVLGSIPFGLLIARARGVDIRNEGSKNIGATNVWRVCGKGPGLTTFLLDAGKGWLAVVAGFAIAARWLLVTPEAHGHVSATHLDAALAGIVAAIGCIVGHSFPVWLKFKGGKGVATSLGVIIGMMPVAAAAAFVVWGVVFWLSRYVSLASICAAAALPVIVFGLMCVGWIHGWAFFWFALVAGLLVVARHRENIKRLVAGTENRMR